jgi:hypothetical protein
VQRVARGREPSELRGSAQRVLAWQAYLDLRAGLAAAAQARIQRGQRLLVELSGKPGFEALGPVFRMEQGLTDAQIETLRTAYDAAAAREKAADARIQSASTTSLFTLLQKSAGELGLALSDLNERRLPVKDSELTEVTVDVNLKEISVDKLVTLLEKIEGRSSDGVVKVSKLKVKTRFDNPEMLEASLTVSTWKAPSGGAGGVGGAEGTKP